MDIKEWPKKYDPEAHEADIYQQWEKSGVLKADSGSTKEPYVISMPPPNATGQLHVGHALFLTIQDILIRTARMQGKEALWLPGTDHAAIATESVVIRKLQAEGINDPRTQLGREELVRRIAEYVENSREVIRSQIRQMGASCDWSRERYTLEPALSRIVNEVFKRMYDDGLIYRGYRIVNWDPNLKTTVSDDEMERREEKTALYTLQYGPFQITTARPETKFGDKYVVMHPNDIRYKQYRDGETFTAEWINGPVIATVIKDEAVDPAFGTGVMTITPWHDAADFEIAGRHNLEKEQIIDFDGCLLPIAGEFQGLKIAEARTKIVEKLKKKRLLIRIDENYVHHVAVNSRGKGVIEPQIKLQWFIDVNKKVITWPASDKRGEKKSLKEVMQEVVRQREVKIYPKRFEKIYFHWIDNLRDWCISRQIWWGHRAPVWYKQNKDGEEQVAVRSQLPPGGGWVQDTDTLDTWFSSALWTWSTLLDKELASDESVSWEKLFINSPDYLKFHPTTVMETGYDILFFWVARMILMTTYVTGQVPFREVYLHGLVSSRSGKKMSKSDPGGMIDPLDMIKQYGADATRFGLMYQVGYGSQVIRFDQEAVKSARNFTNKLWNIARLLASLPERGVDLTVADRWIEQRVQQVAAQVTVLLAKYKAGEAARALYDFVWHDYANWYAEIIKIEGSTQLASKVFNDILRLLHPFMPYITELIWSLGGHGELLITSKWPDSESATQDERANIDMERFKDAVATIRSIRVLLSLPLSAEVVVFFPEDVVLPVSLAKMARVTLVEKEKGGMRRFPLKAGSAVYIGAKEITAERINEAKHKLDREKEELGLYLSRQEQNLEKMRAKAPRLAVAQKEKELNDTRLRLKEIERSGEWLK